MKPFGSFIAVAVAALASIFAFSAPAQAQDETYVDLSIEITVGVTIVFTARNQGTATAYGVTVDVEIADQTIHSTSAGQFTQKSGTACSGNIRSGNTPGTCTSGVWTVGSLGAGEEVSFAINSRLMALPCCQGLSNSWTVPARAVIKNTVPEEEERFKGDNTAVSWIYVNQGGTGTEAAVGRYWLEASVNDLLPDAGDTVKFKFTIRSPTTQHKFIHDAKVRLKLDNGMGTPTATTTGDTATFGAADRLERTWDWDVTANPFTGAAMELSTTLDNPLPAGVARSDLCLTADLTARPGNNLGSVDYVTYTSAEICLEEDPVVLLQDGQATLFSIYPCVGVMSYPCSSADTIEMRVIGDSAARAAGVARDEALLDPARVFVQVKDPEGRRVDSHSGSVNSGTAPSWHTLRPAHTDIGDTAVDGVDVRYTLLAFASGQQANYSQLDRTVTVAGLAGSAAPGAVNIRYPTSAPAAEFAANPSATDTNSWLPANNTTKFGRFVEFEELGTYKLDYTATLTHTDTTNHPNPYSGTGSYIFHVGPVAELDVSDGGADLAPDGTRAFTIIAVNNGPDDAPAAQVTVTDLDATTCTGTATKGSLAFDSSECIWTIGELKNKDYYQEIYGRDGEVLTIFTSAAVDTKITASISNTQDYEVCIDSSGDDVELTSPSETACEGTTGNTWHTAKYYDYDSKNSSAVTIEAKDGTGADLPSLRGARASTAAIVVSWEEIAEVNGRKVTHYEVQRETNPWSEPATTLEPRYVDTGIQAGDTHRYQVRAINDRGQGGPWSAPIAGSVAIPTPEPTPTPEPRRSDPEPANSSPRFTEGGSTTRHVQENSEPGTDVGSPVSAEDRNRDSLTYELGGTDADSFEIVESSGQIRTKAELDYETKTRYRVSVSVSDRKNSRGEANDSVDDVIDVAISVTNQGERGAVTLSEALPVVGTAIEAELSDPDGGISGVSWAWERSADGDVWTEIPDAASRIYTPVDGDSGHYLRVTASYTDSHGPSKSATGASSVPVTALSISERYDGDGDGSISLGEALRAVSDYRDGVITYDEAIAVANLYFESHES